MSFPSFLYLFLSLCLILSFQFLPFALPPPCFASRSLSCFLIRFVHFAIFCVGVWPTCQVWELLLSNSFFKICLPICEPSIHIVGACECARAHAHARFVFQLLFFLILCVFLCPCLPLCYCTTTKSPSQTCVCARACACASVTHFCCCES